MEDMELDMVRTNEQAEYFKDTKIIDKSNNPLLCYHGTKSEIYNEIDFDKLGSQAGSGFGPFLYCSDSEDIAKYYAGGDESHMIAVYLDVRKPLNLTDRDKISFEQYAAILQKADPDAKLGKAMRDTIRLKEDKRSYPQEEGRPISKMVETDYQPPRMRWRDHIFRREISKIEERAAYDVLYENRDKADSDILKLAALYEALKAVNPDLSPLAWNRAVTEVTGYDGFLRKGTSEIGIFFPEQMKAINNFDPQRDNRIFGDAPIKSLAELKKEQAERIATRQRECEKEPERETYRERKPARSHDEYER